MAEEIDASRLSPRTDSPNRPSIPQPAKVICTGNSMVFEDCFGINTASGYFKTAFDVWGLLKYHELKVFPKYPLKLSFFSKFDRNTIDLLQ